MDSVEVSRGLDLGLKSKVSDLDEGEDRCSGASCTIWPLGARFHQNDLMCYV